MSDLMTGNEQYLLKVSDGWREEALKLKAELEAKDAEIGRLRELLNTYNIGGWTDSERLIKQRDALRAALVWMYNQGYQAGHHDTVEGAFTDVHPDDIDTYHDDVVAELIADREALKGNIGG